MKSPSLFRQRKSLVVFLLCSMLLFEATTASSQAPPTMYARVSMLKVAPGRHSEFETFMRETMKPVHTLRREKGKIMLWILFRVNLAGEKDEYNYVEVNYYPAWANTESNLFMADLLKEVHPDSDPMLILQKLRQLRTIERIHMLYRTEAVEPNPPVPSKYVRLDYMKVKPGKAADYLRTEREDWMPFHQTLIAEGKSSGWGLWQLVFPGGTEAPYDYVTSNRYSTYDQIIGTDYEGTFKKASSSKKSDDIFNRTTQSRDLVKSELWEVVDML